MAGKGTGVFTFFYERQPAFEMMASLRPGFSDLSTGKAVWQDWLFGPSGTNAFVLAAAFATFTLTGEPASLNKGRTLVANNATFTLTGEPASLLVGHRLVANNAVFTFTGEPASLLVAHKLTAAFATFTFTGEPASLLVGHRLVANNAVFTFTGKPALLLVAHRLAAAFATFTFTGEPASLNKGRTLVANNATFALTGEPVTFRRTYNLAAAKATFTFNGQDATLFRHVVTNYLLLAATGVFVFTPFLALLRKIRIPPPPPPFDVANSWSIDIDRSEFQLIAYNATNRQFLVILVNGDFALWTNMPPTITGAIQYAKDKQLFLHNLTPPTIASYTP